MELGKRTARALPVLERKLRALGRCFTPQDIQDLYGCSKSTAYKVVRHWLAEGRIQPARIVREPGARMGHVAYEFTDAVQDGRAPNQA